MSYRVLIIGGYGNFGTFIVESLAKESDLTLIIAGRSAQKAESLRQKLNPKAKIEIAELDIHNHFADQLNTLKPNVVIHTSGPFQGQGYDVANACIQFGCHYIDLADGREFVTGIGELDVAAKEKNVTIISGASSVPGLSSAIIEHYMPSFEKLEEVEYAIATAQRTNRGLATLKAVLSYAGKPFTTIKNGKLTEVYGWSNITFRKFWKLRKRTLSYCDIPDLELFPQQYPDLKTVEFRAGLELKLLHFLLIGWSYLVKLGLLKSLQPLSNLFLKASYLFDWIGTDDSGFYMELRGFGAKQTLKTTWFEIIACEGSGLCIPAIPAIILTKKLARNEGLTSGAMACLGLVTLNEYLPYLEAQGIEHREVSEPHAQKFSIEP